MIFFTDTCDAIALATGAGIPADWIAALVPACKAASCILSRGLFSSFESSDLELKLGILFLFKPFNASLLLFDGNPSPRCILFLKWLLFEEMFSPLFAPLGLFSFKLFELFFS